MYNGGAEFRGNFLQRALGLDRIISRMSDLAMFETDGIPDHHHMVTRTVVALERAQYSSILRILGLMTVVSVAAVTVLH